MQKNEVTTKSENKLSTNVAGIFQDMEYSATEAKDLLIPKLLLMQGSSKYVKEEGICKAGDLVKSTTGEVLGSVREKDHKSINFVPVYMFKTWVKHELVKDNNGKEKQEYVETYPVTPMNTDQQWYQEKKELDENGKEITRKYRHTKNINFYVILEKDFGSPLSVPYVLSFRSSSSRAAAIIEDWFAQCKAAKQAGITEGKNGQLMLPFGKVFELGGKIEKNNDDQSWFVLQTKEAGITEEAVLSQAYNWYKVVSKSTHTDIDNSDVVESAPAPTQETEF